MNAPRRAFDPNIDPLDDREFKREAAEADDAQYELEEAFERRQREKCARTYCGHERRDHHGGWVGGAMSCALSHCACKEFVEPAFPAD